MNLRAASLNLTYCAEIVKWAFEAYATVATQLQCSQSPQRPGPYHTPLAETNTTATRAIDGVG